MPLIQDIRFGLRLLRRMPGFTATAIVILALGIGATTAIFSVVHAVMLAPLPFADGDRLVVVRGGPSVREATPISYPAFLEWRDAGVFDALESYFLWSAALTGNGDPENLNGIRVSGTLPATLGVKPLAGVLFTRADEPRNVTPKVLIGEGLWHRRFGGSHAVVGQPMTLGGVTFTIVGVVPHTFRMRPTDDPPDVIVPLRLNDTIAPASLNFLTAVGRLKPGQSPAQAQEQLQAVARRLRPEENPPATVNVRPVRDAIVGDTKGVLSVLLAAVACLLLITCANLANLLLARTTSRQEEMGVRLALGANRLRVVRQLLTESLVLSLAGGALGTFLAWLGVTVAGDLAVVRAAGAYDVAINWAVLAFALAVSIAAGVLFGLAPAITAGQQSLRSTVGHAHRVSGAHPLRAALIVAEVSLTLVLLAGAGLLVRSFVNLLHVDRGYSTERVLAFELAPTGARYPTPAVQTQFFQSMLDRLSQLPGVAAVGFSNERPLGGGGVNGGTPIAGRTFPPGQLPFAEKRIVSEGYFRALAIRVLEGRTFDARDVAGGEPVMVVSESFARRYFPNERAIGQRVGFNWDMEGFQTVIGVVADIKHYGLDDPPLPMVYVSYLQRPTDFASVVMKTSGDPSAIVPAVRDTIRAIDRNLPLKALTPMDAAVSESVATRRFLLWLSGAFAGLGLVLAATGIFGVVSYTARQRTREFGIRVALGAQPRHIARLAATHGLVPVVLGLVIGAAGALAATRALQAQLFGVEPTDPLTFALVIAGLAVVALLACLLPARRAVRVNPVSVLRV